MLTLGLDIATHTGMALVGGEEDRTKSVEVNQRGFSRLQSIATEVERTIKLWIYEVGRIDLVVIEGYAYSKNIDVFVTLVECGCCIRQVLFNYRLLWVEVSPKLLKKWTTGKGNADKPMMAEFAKKRWGFVNDNEDIVDAFALAKLGQVGFEELMQMPGVKKGF